jgi:hypothetical protein
LLSRQIDFCLVFWRSLSILYYIPFQLLILLPYSNHITSTIFSSASNLDRPSVRFYILHLRIWKLDFVYQLCSNFMTFYHYKITNLVYINNSGHELILHFATVYLDLVRSITSLYFLFTQPFVSRWNLWQSLFIILYFNSSLQILHIWLIYTISYMYFTTCSTYSIFIFNLPSKIQSSHSGDYSSVYLLPIILHN